MDEFIQVVMSLFDVRFMVFVFLTSQVLLKYTNFKKLKTNEKRMFVLFIGAVYAVLISQIDFMLSNIGQSALFLLNKYGISLFATVLFYDIIYKQAINKLTGGKK